VTNVVSADDLKFAYVRARWLDSPQQVAADLLAAATRPKSLDGVSALQARIRAGGVLADFGDRDAALDILRSAAADSQAGSDSDARLFLAAALAQAGEVAQAEAVARESIAAEAGGHERAIAFSQYLLVARGFAQAGLRDLAMRWADDGVAAASTVRGSRSLRFRAEQIAARMRDGVVAQLRAAQQSGPGGGKTASFVGPPWPAVTNSRLLWWPEDHYGRLVRQVPVLRDVLGRSWPDHAWLVESALRESTRRPGEPVPQTAELAAGDFDDFTSFLQSNQADPRDRAAMTAYGLSEWAAPVVIWPPKSRKPCWCGSGRRYQDCCGASAQGAR
jgi:hypothetical protein